MPGGRAKDGATPTAVGGSRRRKPKTPGAIAKRERAATDVPPPIVADGTDRGEPVARTRDAADHLREEGEAPMGGLAEVADSAGGDTWGELSPGSKGGRRKVLGKVLGQVGGDSGGRGASPWTWTGGEN